MSKPKVEINEKVYFKEVHFLYEIISSLSRVEELKPFLKDILTSSELRMLKRRWFVAGLLLEGNDIRTTANKSKTSTQTVSKIKKILEEGNGGLKLAVEKSLIKQSNEKKEYLKSIKPKGGSKFVKGW
jgi:TrpR-related protein YerC/YecD